MNITKEKLTKLAEEHKMMVPEVDEPGTEMIDQEIGTNPLPIDAQEKLGEFLDWLDVHYEVEKGTTALYWCLSYEIGKRIKR